jgi:hypothetical protein
MADKNKSNRGTGRRWRQWTESEARAVLDELARSGGSLAEFARSKKVSTRRLSYWRKRLGDAGAPPAFVSVALPHESSSSPVEIVSGRVVVRVRDDVDADRIARIVEALARRLGC